MLLVEFISASRPMSADETFKVLALGSVRVVILDGDTHYLLPSRRVVQPFRALYPSVRRSRIWTLPTLRDMLRATGEDPRTFLTAAMLFESWQEGRLT